MIQSFYTTRLDRSALIPFENRLLVVLSNDEWAFSMEIKEFIMARRTIFTPKEIQRRRASCWAWHYKNRQVVRQLSPSVDSARIATIIYRVVPMPVIRIDGSLTEGADTLKGVERALIELCFSWLQRDLICTWYWSQSGWNDFVEQFQSLPEPTENYYLVYNPEADATLLVPISQREPNSNKGTKKVHEGTSTLLVPFES